MTLALDASTPAMATSQTSTVTTATFTPPAGSVLVACVGAYTDGTWVPVISDSRGLTWIESGQYATTAGGSILYYATVDTTKPITVTFSHTAETYDICALQVLVFTGARMNNPISTYATGGSVDAVVSDSLTTVYDQSQVWLVNMDFGGQAIPTPDANCETYSGERFVDGMASYWTMWVARRLTAIATAGTVVVMASTALDTGNDNSWVQFEVAESAATFDAGGHVTSKVELLIDGTWTDVTSRVQGSTGININRGRSEGQSRCDPSRMTLTFKNSDSWFSNRNPVGTNYGKLGRNTQVRVTVGSDVRFSGEIPEWPSRADSTGRYVTVEVTAAGIGRRLGIGVRSRMSPLRDFMAAQSPVACWSMLESIDSTSASPLTPGDPVLNPAWVQSGFAQIEGPISAPGKYLNTVRNTYGVPAMLQTDKLNLTSDSFVVDFIANIDLTNFTTNAFPTFLTLKSPNNQWSIYSRNLLDSVTGNGYDEHSLSSFVLLGDYAYILNVNTTTHEYLPPGWHYFRTVVVQTGGTLTMMNYIDGTLQSAGSVAVATIPAPNIVEVVANTSSAANSLGLGYLSFYNYGDEPPVLDMYNAFMSHPGESASDRIDRLCTRNGVTFNQAGIGSGSQPVGRQRPGTLLDAINEASDADMGIQFDPRDTLGLSFRPLRDLYGQGGPTISYTDGVLSDPLEPVDDDALLCNESTITRTDGATATVARTTGPLNSGDPSTDPQAVGLYDQEATLNLHVDSQCADTAGWIVGKGTWDQIRFPQITVDLHREVLRADPDLSAALVAVDVGSMLTLTNLPHWLPPDDVKLLVVGYREEIGAFTWRLIFNCEPAGPYEVGVYDDGVSRYDTAGSILETGVDETETSWSVVTTTGPIWSTADEPYDLTIGGERVTVTAMVGATSPQTATVTRSVNGVVKSHLAGASISLHQPAMYGR